MPLAEEIALHTILHPFTATVLNHTNYCWLQFGGPSFRFYNQTKHCTQTSITWVGLLMNTKVSWHNIRRTEYISGKTATVAR